MQATHFLNFSVVSLLIYCHIILYWEKVTPSEKILPLKSKLSGKF